MPEVSYAACENCGSEELVIANRIAGYVVLGINQHDAVYGDAQPVEYDLTDLSPGRQVIWCAGCFETTTVKRV